jgi:glycine/serine hydroxymethyltransferase
MVLIADLIDEVLMNKDQEAIITKVRGQVNDLMSSFELFS